MIGMVKKIGIYTKINFCQCLEKSYKKSNLKQNLNSKIFTSITGLSKFDSSIPSIMRNFNIKLKFDIIYDVARLMKGASLVAQW